MSKKMMLFALAVVSAAFFALPAIASAEEIHLDPGNGQKFNIAGPGGSLRAQEEPSITCEGTGGKGNFDPESSTTGFSELEFTGCHVVVLFTFPCHTVGAPANNTIVTKGTFHLITWKNATGTAFPAILLTAVTTTIECTGLGSTITVTGSVIGTITSPKCGKESKEVSLSFTATGTTQNHLEYTGVKYDLQSTTGTQAEKTAALEGTATNTSENAQTLTCT